MGYIPASFFQRRKVQPGYCAHIPGGNKTPGKGKKREMLPPSGKSGQCKHTDKVSALPVCGGTAGTHLFFNFFTF